MLKKDVEATKICCWKKLNNYEVGNLQDECRFIVKHPAIEILFTIDGWLLFYKLFSEQ
jgi:hypothetical protein